MSNAVGPYMPQSIVAADGTTFNMPAGGIGALLPGGTGGFGERLYRIVPGQPRDNRFKEGSSQFYLTRKIKNAAGVWVDENVGPLGAEVTVWPIGYALGRSMFPTPYVDGDKPLCGSNDFIQPDLRFVGQTLESARDGSMIMVGQCAMLKQRTDAQGNVVRQWLDDVCPFAKFSQDKSGKPIKPQCAKLYIIGCVVGVPDPDGDGAHWELAELVHKVSSAKFGDKIIKQLVGLAANGKPAWTFPLSLRITEAGQGNSFESMLDMRAEFEDEHVRSLIPTLDDMNTRWQEYLKNRIDNAQYVPENADNVEPVAAGSIASANIEITAPASVAVKSKNGNGKKPLI